MVFLTKGVDVGGDRICSWVDGRSSSAERGEIAVFDPSTGGISGAVVDGGAEAVEQAVAAARRAHAQHWGQFDLVQRIALLHRWSELIAAAAGELGALEGLEVGRPISDSLAMIGFAPFIIHNSANLAQQLALPEDGVSRRARGVVAIISPWNVPVLNVVGRAAPALVSGNTIVVKPSEYSSRVAIRLAQLATEAGLPPGTFNVVLGSGDVAGAALAAHPDVDLVAFTGSTRTGQAIARTSSSNSLRPLLMECGGKSPQIILPDMIDEPGLWSGVFRAAFWNTGQWCAAKSRLLVPAGSAARTVEGLAAVASQFRIGHPSDSSVDLGPLANRDQFDKVRAYQAKAREVADVVTLPCQMGEVDPNGYFVRPEVVVEPPEQSAVVQDEIFGPILTVQEYQDVDDAVRLGNDTVYGLAATIWTKDRAIAGEIAPRLDAALLNVLTSPASNPLFGGGGTCEPRKQSGYGHEGGLSGLAAYTVSQSLSFC